MLLRLAGGRDRRANPGAFGGDVSEFRLQPAPENQEQPKGGWIAWGDGGDEDDGDDHHRPLRCGFGTPRRVGLGLAGGSVAFAFSVRHI